MTDMNRRSFLKLATACVAVLAVPVQWVRRRLYGDGVTDDTEALQALIDGEVVDGPNGEPLRRTYDPVSDTEIIYIPRGTYRVSDALKYD